MKRRTKVGVTGGEGAGEDEGSGLVRTVTLAWGGRRGSAARLGGAPRACKESGGRERGGSAARRADGRRPTERSTGDADGAACWRCVAASLA